MPTIAWDGTFAICAQRLKGLVEANIRAGLPTDWVVVFDGLLPPVPAWLEAPFVKVCATGQRSGPATARNLAAQHAKGDVLVFVDADVELHPESLDQFRRVFQEDPTLDAVFGSYDDAPAAPGVVSRFRNLLHHHTHHSHGGLTSTFWAGCGAMRRDRFLALGGFDTVYGQPSIEDVELGLRLWRQGGRILLDPTIQGCHHKRWTLLSMVGTDIRHRAIPWTRLILEQGNSPATLNLSPAGRASGALAPLVPFGLALTLLPGTRIAGAAIAAVALLLLLALNLSFHSLHARRRGWAEAIAGVGLHVLHLCCASLTFAVLASLHWLNRPLAWPPAWRHQPTLRHWLGILALTALALLAILVLAKGLALGWSNAKDLRERLQEWEVFRRGHYPLGGMYGGQPPPGLRSSPYPAWAIPLLALFFHPWGLHQGIITIQLVSLVSLAFMAWCGFLHLRPHGRVASWVGALGPVAIAGNANALAVAQFSILCMGLIFLEWRLLRRQQPLAAGLCWALAMIKPQIALLHGAAFLWGPRTRRGLGAGLLVLALLSSLALLHTRLSPLTYGQRFIRLLNLVQDDSGWNLSWQLSRWGPTLPIVLGLSGLSVLVLLWSWPPKRQWWIGVRASLQDPDRRMIQAGICSLVGFLGFYHRSTDNIMLAPALLAMADLCWRWRRLGITALTVLLGASLWIPSRFFLTSPLLPIAQKGIWCLCLMVLAMSCLWPRQLPRLR